MSTNLRNWSATAVNNQTPVNGGWPEGMPRKNVNDRARMNMATMRQWYLDPAWVDPGGTPTYVSGTQFTIADDTEITDYSQYYKQGRRLRLIGTTPFIAYATITSVTYSAPTTTVNFEVSNAVTVDSSLSNVEYGSEDPDNPSIPALQVDALRGYIDGLIMSNDAVDTDHDIAVAAGTAQADTNDATGTTVGTITKQIDADWAAGDDVGGNVTPVQVTGTFTTSGTAVTGVGTLFDTEFSVGDILYSDDKSEGRQITVITDANNMTIESAFTTDVSVADDVKRGGLAPNTWYHVHMLITPAGTADFGFDVRLDGALILADSTVSAAGYTKQRRIGPVLTDSSSNIIQFFQDGDYFYWKDRIEELSTTTGSTGSRTLLTISTPPGVKTTAILNLNLDTNNLTDALLITSPDENDQTPVHDALCDSNDESTNVGKPSKAFVKTNTSSQIGYRNLQGTTSYFTIYTQGYMDKRGRDA